MRSWFAKLESTIFLSFRKRKAFTIESYAFAKSSMASNLAFVRIAASTLHASCKICSPAWNPNCDLSVVITFCSSVTTAFSETFLRWDSIVSGREFLGFAWSIFPLFRGTTTPLSQLFGKIRVVPIVRQISVRRCAFLCTLHFNISTWAPSGPTALFYSMDFITATTLAVCLSSSTVNSITSKLS